jgi:hypothetical protein
VSGVALDGVLELALDNSMLLDQLFTLLSSQLNHPHPLLGHRQTGDEQSTPSDNAAENTSAPNPSPEYVGKWSNTMLTQVNPAFHVDCPRVQTASPYAHRMLPETFPNFEFLQFDQLMPYGLPNTDEPPVYGPGATIQHASNMDSDSHVPPASRHLSMPEPSEFRGHSRGSPAESDYQHSFNEATTLGDDHLMLGIPYELVKDL